MTDSYSGVANLSWEEVEFLAVEKSAALFIGLDAFTMLLIIFGNGAVLYLVARYRHLRTTTNYYIVSLCVSDIFVAVFTVPLRILGHFSTSDLTSGLCKFVEFVDYLSLASNIFCVVAIAINRHCVIVYPLSKRLSPPKCVRNISFVWIISAAYGIRATLVYDVTHTQHYINDAWQSYYKCDVPITNAFVNKYLLLLDFFILYIAPLALIMVLYVRIWVALHKSTNKVSTMHAARKRKKKVIKMLLMVVLLFAVCQLPAHIVQLVMAWFIGPLPGSLLALEVADLVSFSNGWLNVIAYILFNDSFSSLILVRRRLRRIHIIPQEIPVATIDV